MFLVRIYTTNKLTCMLLTVQYSTVQYSTVQYSTVQYSTVQYSTVQYSSVQYSTVQYGSPDLEVYRTNVASVGSVFNDTRKIKVLSLPETIKENRRFERPTPDEGPSLETSIFPLSFQVVREPLPFADLEGT